MGALRLPSLTSIFAVSSTRSSLFPCHSNQLSVRKLTSASKVLAKSHPATEAATAELNQKPPVQEQGITPRSQDFNVWYLDVISMAELADYGPVRGTMVIRPYGYAIWEAIQDYLNIKFKETGHSNMYFPQFIPYSFIEKEASHVEGFSPELALVTVGGGKELEEKLVVRPTSETIVNHMFTQWIQSYRDLPLMINQVVIVPIWKKANEKNEVLDAALSVKDVLHSAGIKVKLDDSDQRTPGWKFNFWEMKGVPLRIEIGPRDVSSRSVVISRRDIPGKPGKVFGISMESSVLVPYIKEKLDEIQSSLLHKAIAFRDSNIVD